MEPNNAFLLIKRLLKTKTETAALIRDLSPPLAYDTTTTADPGLLPPAVPDKGGGDDGDGATITSSRKPWCSQQRKRALWFADNYIRYPLSMIQAPCIPVCTLVQNLHSNCSHLINTFSHHLATSHPIFFQYLTFTFDVYVLPPKFLKSGPIEIPHNRNNRNSKSVQSSLAPLHFQA